jgi:uncharacterized membrane protein YozB (DUF420 family)
MDILMMNLNGLSAIALCVGLYFIKHHNRKVHASMLLAVAFPSLLLVSYIVHHTPHDERFFPGRTRCARGTSCGFSDDVEP